MILIVSDARVELQQMGRNQLKFFHSQTTFCHSSRSIHPSRHRIHQQPHSRNGPDFKSETFRVLKNNEIKQFGEYRTQRLVLAAWDKMFK